MCYTYRDDIALADVAFDAWGQTLEETIIASADALMNVMVENLDAIHKSVRRNLMVESDTTEMLLFRLLEELVYLKDADGVFLRISEVTLKKVNDRFLLEASAYGEEIDPQRHDLNVDVKAVTYHRFTVEQTPQGWKATVVLDV